MDKEWRDVLEFQKAFGHPVADRPCALSPERAQKRYKWMKEEIDEFLEAGGDIVEQADAMIDVMYFALGTLVEMGIKPDRLFEIVHRANMNKLWADGKPHYNEDGKTIKPDTWRDPHQELERAIKGFCYESILARAGSRCCVPALLETALKYFGFDTFDQTGIARHCTAYAPSGREERLELAPMNRVFQAFALPLRGDYSSVLTAGGERSFLEQIERLLREEHVVICGYNRRALYGTGEEGSGGCIVVCLDWDRYEAVLADPGPEAYGLHTVGAGALFSAVRSAESGFWSISRV